MRVSPDCLKFCSLFVSEAPKSPVFGWLAGVENQFVLCSFCCLNTTESSFVVLPKSIKDDLEDLERFLPAGIRVIGFYASHNGASETQLAEHRACFRADWIACYFSAKNVFAAREATSALEWSSSVVIDPGCVQRFEAAFPAVVLCSERRDGEEVFDDEALLLVGSSSDQTVCSFGQMKSKPLSTVFGACTSSHPDFSRVIQVLVRHQPLTGNCPEIVVTNEVPTLPRMSKAVGYFSPDSTVSSAVAALSSKQRGWRWVLTESQGVALPLSEAQLAARAWSSVWRGAADATEVWGRPRGRTARTTSEWPTSGGKVALVRGRFEYCHYNRDDEGWGCAYRALQTVCSWLQLQGLVAVPNAASPLPTHAQIQQALHNLGEPVGPKQWIGAIEVSMVLNHWYGIDCKIINVTSGSEIESKNEEV
jgi:hypothetical protein